MGRYRVELDLANSPYLQRYFDFHWQLIGNLGVDLGVVPLSKLVGLELSVKLIAMTIPPLTVAGFLWVAREVHGRIPPTAAFALPFAFGQPFLFGFLNFTLSMALAFLAFGLWLRLARLGRLKLRLALFVPISFVLFTCHAFGWGTLGLLCFSAEAVRQHDRGIDWWKAGLKAAPHALVMAGPALLMLMWRSDVSGGMTGDLFNIAAKFSALIGALRDRWQVFDIFAVAATLIVLVEARHRPMLGFSRNLVFSSLVLLAFFLALPRIVFGSAYADMRLVPFILATALLAVRFREEADLRTARLIAIAATCFYSLNLVVTTASMAMAAQRQKRLLTMLDHVPRGAALITLVGEPCHVRWALARDTHIGAMAIVRRQAFSNDQWTIEGSNLLGVHFPEAAPFNADPSQMICPNGCGTEERLEVDRALRSIKRDVISYVWTIDLPSHDPSAFAGYRMVHEDGGSRLYRRRSFESAR